MSRKRILWVETMPDRGPRRIIAGTAAVVEAANVMYLIASPPNGSWSTLRAANHQYGDAKDTWQRIADSYNATQLPNVRFWVWGREGWVKLTLEPGQSLSVDYCENTDEGWSRSSTRWAYEYDHDCGRPAVTMEHTTDGTDCDGRLSTERDYFCPVENLHTNEPAADMDADVVRMARCSAESRPTACSTPLDSYSKLDITHEPHRTLRRRERSNQKSTPAANS